MLKKTFATAFLFFAMTVASFAQDINGKWTGKVMDQFDVAYIFKADGEKLTGSTTGPDGNEIIIKDGKIKGGDVEFTINIMENDTKITGKFEGETLKLKFSIMGNDVELVLKKEGK
jgi:hypothetical protein